MTRALRSFVPNTTQLVLVRGINQAAVFFAPEDYALWLDLVRTIAPLHALDIHAFGLGQTQVVLLVTPHNGQAVAKWMQDLGRRYVRAINARYQRSGTLWEGRYRTCFVASEFVLSAYVWMAGLAEDAHASSVLCHLGLAKMDFIREHDAYWGLGNTPYDRQLAFRGLLEQGVAPELQSRLAEAVYKGRALGDEAFLARLAEQTGQRMTPAPRGRPKRARDV